VGAVTAIVAVEAAITLLAQLVVLWRIGIVLPRFGVMERAFRYSLPMAGASLSNNLSTRADRLIVGSVLGPEAVGVYDIAYRIASVLMADCQPAITTFFPEFSRLLEEGEHETCGRYVRNGVRYFTILAIPSIFGLVLVNEQLVGLVAEPETAARTKVLMPVLAMGITFWGFERLYGVVLIASENTLLTMAIRGTAAILNVLLNFLLIPVFGLLGAAATTLASYSLSLMLMYRYSNRIAASGIDLGTVVRATVAAAVMYVVVVLAVPKQLLVVLVVAPVVYFGVMALSGGIRDSDIRTLRSWL
jgi:O-antigen/teichoic acid export membrane protein